MANKKFTDEEIKSLYMNPYTLSVSHTQLRLTYEFKMMAAKKINQGIPFKTIMKEAGYDLNVIGKDRLYSESKQLRKTMKSPNGIQNNSQRSRERNLEKFAKKNLENETQKRAIKELKNQVLYLQEEVELLKKISLMNATSHQPQKDSS